MIQHIETERLLLRNIEHQDKEGLFELDSDMEVHRYLGGNVITHADQIPAVIDFIQQQYKNYGIGRWAVIDKQSGDFMGWCGLKYFTESIQGKQNFYELGYRLIRRYWGLGIATEAAVACTTYGFNELRLQELFAMTDSANQGSDRVLRKVGFDFLGTFDLDAVAHNWYRATSR